MNKSYNEIRSTCKLVDYVYKLACNSALWIEIYEDNTHEYRALFSPESSSPFPSTITQVLLNEPQRFDYS